MSKRGWISLAAGGSVVLAVVLISVLSTRDQNEPAVVRVGAVLPLTGSAAHLGQWCKNGLELAYEELRSAESRPAGIKLELFCEDSEGEGTIAASAGKKLVSLQRVDVLTCLTTTETSVLAPIAKRNKVVLLTGTLTPGAADFGDYVFRNASSLDKEALTALTYAIRHLKLTRVAILGLQIDAHVRVEKILREKIPGLGGKLVAVEKGKKESTDFRTQITKMLGERPEAVYVMGYDEIGYMIRQARELGYKGRILADPSMESPSVLRIAGDAANGVIYTRAELVSAEGGPQVNSFVGKYRSRFGQMPEVYAGQFYDSLHIIALAAKEAREQAGSLRAALLSIRDYPGVTGKTSFLKNGDVEKPVALKLIRDGKPAFLETEGRELRGGQ